MPWLQPRAFSPWRRAERRPRQERRRRPPGRRSPRRRHPRPRPTRRRPSRPRIGRPEPSRSRRASSTSRPARTPTTSRPAADGGVWYTGQRTGVLGHLDPATGAIREIPLGDRLGAARRHRRAGWRAVDHRRRANAIVRVDPGDRRGPGLPAPGRPAGREPQHRRLRLATASSGSPASPASTAGWTRRPARSPSSTTRRAAARTASRPRRAATSGTPRSPAATSPGSTRRPGRPTIVEPPTSGQGARRVWSDSSGPDLGQRVECRPGRRPRPGDGHMAGMALPGDAPAGVRRLRRRARHRLADRLRRERHRPLRPGDRDVRRDRAAQPRTPPSASSSADPARSGAPSRRPTSWSSSPKADAGEQGTARD